MTVLMWASGRCCGTEYGTEPRAEARVGHRARLASVTIGWLQRGLHSGWGLGLDCMCYSSSWVKRVVSRQVVCWEETTGEVPVAAEKTALTPFLWPQSRQDFGGAESRKRRPISNYPMRRSRSPRA